MKTKKGSIDASRPLELLCIDYTKLDKSINGKENVLVMIDAYSKFTVAVVTKDQTANTVVKTPISQWFNKYGFPERIHSDQGKNFLSSIVEETCQYYGITKYRTTPYHPSGNGIVERFNRTLHNLIRILEEEQKTE